MTPNILVWDFKLVNIRERRVMWQQAEVPPFPPSARSYSKRFLDMDTQERRNVIAQFLDQWSQEEPGLGRTAEAMLIDITNLVEGVNVDERWKDGRWKALMFIVDARRMEVSLDANVTAKEVLDEVCAAVQRLEPVCNKCLENGPLPEHTHGCNNGK